MLSSFASRYKNTYIPNRNIWVNKLSFDISNSKVKECLTIDTRDINDLGPSKFRTQAGNRTEQICYYNRNRKDTSFNCFLASRKETSSPSEKTFSIVKVIDNANKHDSINFDENDELSDFKNNIVQRTIQSASKSDTFKKATTKRQNIRQREYTGHGRVSKSQDFFQSHNNVNNTIGKRYTTTRIKSRKFLSNIAYVGINNENYSNENFVFDVYLLVTKSLNHSPWTEN